MMEKRLNRLSKDPKNFNNTKPSYQTALPQPKKQKIKKTRNIIFFNLPYCQSVKTNIRKKNFDLIDKHFKSMKNIFNRNNYQVSY